MSAHPATPRRRMRVLERFHPGARLGRHASRRGQEFDAEAGDSLVEVLAAIVVLGVTAVAMLLAFGTAFSSSQEHRDLTDIATAQKSVTQQIVAQLQNQGGYVSCATVAAYQTGASAVTFANLPKGYTAQVTGVSYWTGAAFTTNQPQCAANSAMTTSSQLISATLNYPTGQNSIVTAVVANPVAPPPPSPGTATHLVFYTQPGGAQSAQPLNPQPVVEVLDANGNVVTNDLSQVVLTLNAGNGASLAGSCVGSEHYGVVSFSGCSVADDGTYTMTATDGTLTPATSSQFTVSLGPAAQLAFTQQPGATTPAKVTGGTPFPTQPQVTVYDAGGNVVTSDSSTVTLSITSGTGTSGANLSGCTQTGESSGVISFGGCQIDKTGTGYTLTATATEPGGQVTTTSASFTVNIGAPAQLVFTTSPGASTSGTAFGTQPVVTVEDAGGNTITSGNTGATDQITLAVNTGSGTLSCTSNPKSASAGVVTFSGCAITASTPGAFTLKATDTQSGRTGVAAGLSASFTVAGTTPSKLVFATSPSNSVSGVAFGTQPVVWVEDSAGDLITTNNTTQVTLVTPPTGGTNPKGATAAGSLSSCSSNPATASGGIVTFGSCKITVTTSGPFTLSATASGLTGATSNSFTVSGAASQLVFTSQPSNSTGGTAFPTQPVVTVEDSNGVTVTNSASQVALAITSGTGTSGAHLNTCSAQTATAGVATFSGCSIDLAGANYELTATASGLTSATSSQFSIAVGPAAKLAFTTQPSGGPNAVSWATQPVVTVEDSGGNPITSATNQVSLAIGAQPGSGAAVTCAANPIAASAGVAAFSACDIVGTAGTNAYTLVASAPGLSNGTSNAFSITVGAAAQLAFTTQPSGGANTAVWSTQPAVTIEDSGGNKVTGATNSITLSLAQNAGGTFSCASLTVPATASVATFAGCSITGTAGTYSLSATTNGLTSATSSTFTLTFGTATQLVFTTQPGGGADAAAWPTQPAVSAEDVSGNVVTSFSSNITLGIKTQPGTGATLSCGANPVTAGSGTATFSGCQITGALGTYTLSATSSTLNGVSAGLPITIGAPAQLAFGTQPGGGANGSVWASQPAVVVEDAGGNAVTTATNAVTLGLGVNPGGTVGCSANPLDASGGTASFAGCMIIGKAGSYTLTASATGLTGATSTQFTVSPGPATQLGFTTQPGGGQNGTAWSAQPQVSVEDGSGNVVTSGTGSNAAITLGLGTNPGGTLACTTNPLNASGGTAPFTGCTITGKAGTYTLTASASGLNSATSSQFTISAGAPSQLVFRTQPGGGADGAAWSTQPAVNVEDASGNVVTSGTGSNTSVTLAVGTSPGGTPTLTCTTNPLNASAGVASFAGCKITGLTGAYTLTASATGLTGATSSQFTLTVGAPAQLAFGTQPGGGTDGVALTTQPAVVVEDAGGNTVTTATNAVTLAIGTNPGGTPTLTCSANPLNATNGTGIASFAGCKVTGKVGNYTLTASATGLTGATSSQFAIAIGAPAQLAFGAQPGGGKNGSAWAGQPAVVVEDAGGNTVTTATNAVTLALGTNPGGTLACTTNPLNASSGTASFAGCAITGKAGSYTLTASATGLTGSTSTPFTISAGTATQLVFTTEPGGSVTEGTPWSTQPTVTVEDANGNAVTSYATPVTLGVNTYTAGPGGFAQGAVSGCTNPATPNNGVATFSGCTIAGNAGAGTYTLQAQSGTLSATSTSVTMVAGSASQLVFWGQPGGQTTEGGAFPTQPTVTVEDNSGNIVTTYGTSIQLSVAGYTAGNGGSTEGSVSCTANPQTPTGGSATFAGCTITGTAAAGTYTFQASSTSGGLTSPASSSVTIIAGSASKLAFSTQPGNGSASGSNLNPQPAVSIEDANGNVVTTATNQVTLSIAASPASRTGTLHATANPVSAVAGVATFSGVNITHTNSAKNGWELGASSSGLTGATSNAFST